MRISQAAIEKRLRKLEQDLKAKSSGPMMPEFFYVWTDIEDVEAFEREAQAKCKAMKPERYPCFVRFVGPNGGPELGTGPLNDQSDICDEDYSEDTDET